MSRILDTLRYSKDHEWVRIEGEKAYVGITDHAQDELPSSAVQRLKLRP